MGKILVGIDVHDGLPEAIDIEWRGRHISQRLDYVGISFRCSWCRGTGHLRRDCSGTQVEEKSEEDDIREDPLEYVTVEDFLGSGPSFFEPEPALSPEELVTLIGKLKTFCPLFFKSLSLWEREALENSSWLQAATSTDFSKAQKDSDVSVPVGVAVVSPGSGDGDSGVGKGGSFRPHCTVSNTHQPTQPLDDCHSPSPRPSSPVPQNSSSVFEPGFREAEEGDSSLLEVLDSLIPFIKDKSSSIKLPTFMGKAIHNASGDLEASTSKVKSGKEGKEYAWSRGLGIELSPLKTRSTRKKQALFFHKLKLRSLPPPIVGLLEHVKPSRGLNNVINVPQYQRGWRHPKIGLGSETSGN
jgi:hypothetical protein